MGGASPVSGDKISFWSIKVEKFNQSKSAKKSMQVGIDVTCMYTSFGGCGLTGFGGTTTFQKCPNFPFGAGLYSMVIEKFNQLESVQKIPASRH